MDSEEARGAFNPTSPTNLLKRLRGKVSVAAALCAAPSVQIGGTECRCYTSIEAIAILQRSGSREHLNFLFGHRRQKRIADEPPFATQREPRPVFPRYHKPRNDKSIFGNQHLATPLHHFVD